MDWMKIITAGLLILMIVYLWPSAKSLLKNSPKASGNDIMSALIPLVLVLLFVFILIKSV
jgi:hypothetical protein